MPNIDEAGDPRPGQRSSQRESWHRSDREWLVELSVKIENLTGVVDRISRESSERSGRQDSEYERRLREYIVELHERIKALKSEIEERLKTSVTQDQFWPVRTIVYGLAGLALTAVAVALVALVVR